MCAGMGWNMLRQMGEERREGKWIATKRGGKAKEMHEIHSLTGNNARLILCLRDLNPHPSVPGHWRALRLIWQMCKLCRPSQSGRLWFTRNGSLLPWLRVWMCLILWLDMENVKAMRGAWLLAAVRGSEWKQVPSNPTLHSLRMLRSPQAGHALSPVFWQIILSPALDLGLGPIKEKQLGSGATVITGSG